MSTNKKIVKLPKIKRIADVLVTFLLLVLAIIPLGVLALCMFTEFLFFPSSRGPIFYHEKRISQGKIFELYKFRIFKLTSIEKASRKGKVVHTKVLEGDKNNLTFYGRVLRQIYMDEFPQLWNVLRGDMTLIGPRPTNIENSKKAREEGDMTREVMKCGLTGPFQSMKGISKGQREIDEEYINFLKNSSSWQIIKRDTLIIWRTVKTIFRAEGI